MNIRYRVELEEDERRQLEALVAGGSRAVREVKRAQILLAAAAGCSDEGIARTVQVGTSTVYRTKRRFVEESLEAALSEDPRPGGKRKLTGSEEALLIATACSTPPTGRARWTLALLADAVVALTPHARISRHTIGRRLAENDLKPWQQKMWCVPKIDAEYVARMEDVLDLYTQPPAAGTAVVCVDESPRQLIGEVRSATPVAPGRRARQDYEYRRNGTANVFVAVDAHRPWRAAKVTARRAAVDFAEWMRDLVDGPYAGSDADPGRPRQPVHAYARGVLRGVRAGRGPPGAPQARVPLRAEARQLAQHGRDRNRRAGEPVSGPPHSRPRHTDDGSGGVDAARNRRRRGREMDVWDRAGAPQAGARLPDPRGRRWGCGRLNRSDPLRRGTSRHAGLERLDATQPAHQWLPTGENLGHQLQVVDSKRPRFQS